MTIATTGNRVSFSGNGSTTAFAFSNNFIVNADLVVKVVTDSTGISALQVLDTDFTVTGAGVAGGGTVTMTTAPATGETLVILRDPAVTQAIDHTEGDALDVDTTLEQPLDLLTMLVQRSRDLLVRALSLPDEDTTTDTADALWILPAKADRLSKVFTFDANGFPTATTVVGLGTVTVPVSVAQGGTGSITASAARTALGVVIGSDVQAYSSVLDATTASFLTADETKLDGIEASADVTDATNVASAGAAIKTSINVFTLPQTAKTIADTDGSFDMDATTHVTWVPAAADQLTFTNITVGRSGMIKIENPSAYAITIDSAAVEAPGDAATELSVAGTYTISYWVPNGETKALIEVSRAQS